MAKTTKKTTTMKQKPTSFFLPTLHFQLLLTPCGQFNQLIGRFHEVMGSAMFVQFCKCLFLKPLRLWDGTGALCKGRAYAGGFENGELFSKYWQHMILTIWQVQGLSLVSKGFENILDFIFNFSLWGGAAILGNTPWCGKLWRSGRKRSCCEVNILKIKYNFSTIF